MFLLDIYSFVIVCLCAVCPSHVRATICTPILLAWFSWHCHLAICWIATLLSGVCAIDANWPAGNKHRLCLLVFGHAFHLWRFFVHLVTDYTIWAVVFPCIPFFGSVALVFQHLSTVYMLQMYRTFLCSFIGRRSDYLCRNEMLWIQRTLSRTMWTGLDLLIAPNHELIADWS